MLPRMWDVYVCLFCERERQYSPIVRFLRERNLVVTSERPTKKARLGAPCADSELSLKEKMARLDDMELVYENQNQSNETSDEESVG